MKLEFKLIAGYLPYGLKGQTIFCGEKNTYTIAIDNVMSCIGKNQSIKPILHPLSDLTKFCEDLGFVPIEKLAEIEEIVCVPYSINFFETSMKYLPYWIVEKLYEWHFDIHNLIENNLAIDINTL